MDRVTKLPGGMRRWIRLFDAGIDCSGAGIDRFQKITELNFVFGRGSGEVMRHSYFLSSKVLIIIIGTKDITWKIMLLH